MALVVELEDKIIGFLLGVIKDPGEFTVIKKIGVIESLFILEEYRQLGIGKNLMTYFSNWASQKKCERLSVLASYLNKRAIKFYKNYGFFDFDLILEKVL